VASSRPAALVQARVAPRQVVAAAVAGDLTTKDLKKSRRYKAEKVSAATQPRYGGERGSPSVGHDPVVAIFVAGGGLWGEKMQRTRFFSIKTSRRISFGPCFVPGGAGMLSVGSLPRTFHPFAPAPRAPSLERGGGSARV